jgi:membrane protein DedA with SNARE-associated domain
MTQSPLTTDLVLIILIAAVPVALPSGLLWLALTHAGSGVAIATFCAALVVAAGCWVVFVVGRVLIEERWRREL